MPFQSVNENSKKLEHVSRKKEGKVPKKSTKTLGFRLLKLMNPMRIEGLF